MKRIAFGDYVERSFGWILLALVIVLIALVALVCLGAYQHSKLPTFTLTKADWRCTEHHVSTVPQPQVVGKAVVITQVVTDECSQWSRR